MIKFSKLQGAGNDFIIIEPNNKSVNDLSEIAKKMCDRHFGIGADGLMAVASTDKADIEMIYFNSDGSRGEMCGNGIRCFSLYAFQKGIVKANTFTVNTLAGIKEVTVSTKKNMRNTVQVHMGTWSFDPKKIPVKTIRDTYLLEKITVDEENFQISCVLMGVPHAVIFVDNIKEINIEKTGSFIENMELFPNKINVNFCNIINRSTMFVDTWERGAGKTLACGTGACAAVVVAHTLGLVDQSVKVSVLGGDLHIRLLEQNVFMEGEAEMICDGEFYD